MVMFAVTHSDSCSFDNTVGDTLDYILASQASEKEEYGLVATRSAPMPSKEEIEKNTAMPSKEWPSDHVSLLCDFEFQTAKK